MTTKKTDETPADQTYNDWRDARIAAAEQAEKDAQKAAEKAANS